MNVLFFKIIYILAGLRLHCCAQAFSSCSQLGLLSSWVRWASHLVASLVCRAQVLGVQASVVVARGLSCPVTCGIFLDQGSNLYPLHWQADSSIFLNNLKILYIFGCAGSLLLCGLFSSCSEQRLLFIALRRLLITVASPVVEQRLEGAELQ